MGWYFLIVGLLAGEGVTGIDGMIWGVEDCSCFTECGGVRVLQTEFSIRKSVFFSRLGEVDSEL